MATHAYSVLDSYIYGFALQERALPVGTPQQLADVGEHLLRQLPADEYPNLRGVGTELMESAFNYADEFGFGLDLILDGLERIRAEA